MLTFDEMPDDNADLAKVKVAFPYLPDNSEKSCPVSMDQILEYVSRESPDGNAVKGQQLKFLRTARVEEREYWIWSFMERDGSRAYVTAAKTSDRIELGYSPDTYRLSPEQFLLGDYHGVF